MLEHDAFCGAPGAAYASLRARLGELGFELPEIYAGPPEFGVHARVSVDPARKREIEHAHRLFPDSESDGG